MPPTNQYFFYKYQLIVGQQHAEGLLTNNYLIFINGVLLQINLLVGRQHAGGLPAHQQLICRRRCVWGGSMPEACLPTSYIL